MAGFNITSADVADSEATLKTLIDVQGATLTINGEGTIEPGTRTNITNYNNTFNTISASNGATVIIDGATVKGSKGINTKYGGTAVYASQSNVTIQNGAKIYGGECAKNGITSSNYEALNFRYNGEAGKAVSAWNSPLTVTDSEIYGGNGTADADTQTSYISGGSNQAAGGLGIYAVQADTVAVISNSTVKGGDSTLYNAENAIYAGFGSKLTVEGCTITGGSCLVQNGYGIAGAGISVPMGECEVTVTESNVTGGSTDDSWIGSGIDVASNAEGSTIKVESSEISAGSGAGNSSTAYAIETGTPISVELKDTTLKANEANGKAVSPATGSVTAEGTLTVEGGTLNTEVFTNGGVTVSGDESVTPRIFVAKIGDTKYTSLQDAVTAANNGDTINVLPVTVDGNSQPVVIDKKVKFDGVSGSEIKNTKFVIKAPVEFNGLKITGDSYIDISDVSATDLSVTNCDVDVNLTERITGKAAFIFATSENHSVKITLKNNNIIANSTNLAYYPAAMFTWANLANESEISNNIFGDDDNRYTFVALKSLNADDGAVITLSNNTVYGTNELWCDFYAFDFCQNNSRSNKYTVLSKNNIVNALPADSNFSVNAFCIESNGQGNATLYDNGTVLNGEPINLNNIGTIQSQAYINVGVNVLLDDDGKIISGVFLNPVPSENMASGYSYKIINGVYVVNDAADKITVKLVPTADKNIYDIVLDGNDLNNNDKEIYEFVSAELQFANAGTTLTNAPMNYEITGAENINVVANTKKPDRYGFYLKDGNNRKTGETITIGQVIFPEQGNINFSVTAEDSTVIATLKGTHLETTYTLGGGYELEAGDPISSNIAAATRNVAINVDFAHTLDNTGWNGDHQITVTLKDAFGNIVGETAHPLAIADNAGTYTFEDVAVGRITVTLKAPGFRTYTYTTTVEEGTAPLVLTFWNDTKRDAEKAVEIGGRTMTNNFVVGDIAMDYIVDKYDLAAVTSYYGTYNLTDESKIKYDLNRDGNIDITDVAYVLHNFGF